MTSRLSYASSPESEPEAGEAGGGPPVSPASSDPHLLRSSSDPSLAADDLPPPLSALSGPPPYTPHQVSMGRFCCTGLGHVQRHQGDGGLQGRAQCFSELWDYCEVGHACTIFGGGGCEGLSVC